MIYMIDHYDSFTFNIVQFLGEIGEEITVRRNDEVRLTEIEELKPDLIFLSPGPRTPEQTGMTLEVIEKFKGVIPIFGVCLGHQAIAYAFGGQIVKTERLMHGKTSSIHHDAAGIYKAIPQGTEVMNYHSLVVDRMSLPDCLEVTAENEDGEIMGIRHRELPVEGVQFHPESIGSIDGRKLLENAAGHIKVHI
ncbi:anthranilate synthase component II [Salinicoccus halodurans]|uniref:Anthranilate synthase subunit II n=1 Tax=Salinicoccus halodurans TaxID=407035 RepID=A0A0F7HN22_9STAP|nr:aminodeoxychorismate/anthranilate synthase component II [Salinicoccus halodurans]AKG74444.1 anthranilate synthase subunit II [Salinicoccus halodurans]SFK96092.1 para-aminobenzoate synthetase component 2 [Salinicoccus halodurans]